LKKLLAWPVFLGIQAVTSIALLFFIYRLGIMPLKYLIVILVVLALLCALTFFLMKPKGEKETVKNLIGKIVSILLSILMIVGNLYVIRGGNALSKFTNATTQTNSISAIVLKNSSAQTINDLEGKTFGINSSVDEGNLEATITELENNIGTVTTKDYKDFETLAEALYSENVDVILMDEAYRTIVEAKYDTFTDEDTRVIWQYQYETKMDDFSKNVDVTSKPFTIYLSGIDTTGKVSTVSRSDVNMLVTVNPTTKQILMTSIPRDYYVTLANKGKKDKLTHAGIFGVKNSVETIENFMGIEINYYAKVNFTSLVTIVDALGGIEVYSDKTINPKHGTTTIYKGTNQMDGATALAFARERYSYSNGDNHRVQNQQEVLKGMIKKMTSPKIITNYNQILSGIEGSFETNMTSKEITSLIQMQIDDMASWDIQQTQLTGTGKKMYGGALMPNNNLYYMIPNDESVATCKGYIEKMMNGETITITD
jgi:LCP family protein required for cell wall assembly